MPGTVLPEQIGRYRVVDELGRGAMGCVYLAEDPRIGRKIALKVLAQGTTVNRDHEDELRRRFLSEVRAAGSLNHPGIVTVFDTDTDPASGEPYLVMEWIEGRTLRQILAEGALEISRSLDLVSQVADALGHAHSHNVVHRDVKPENLLVNRDGVVKVTDFGIAKLRSQSLTLTGHVLGSPYYMAPEQIRGDPVDGRSDLFALGVVLYECLTGVMAFSGDSLASITHKILEVDPRPAAMYNSALPWRLVAALDRALQKRPEDRFQTGEELAAELRAVAPAEAPPAVAPPAESESALNGHTVVMTRTSSSMTAVGSEQRRRAVGLGRRLAGLVMLLFLLPLLATFLRRHLEELPPSQIPEWLAATPEWTDKVPDWGDQIPSWTNEIPDRMSALPDWINGPLERLAARVVNGGAPPAPLSNEPYPKLAYPTADDPERRLGESTETSVQPVSWPSAPPDPWAPPEFFTPLELCSTQAPETPPELCAPQELLPSGGNPP